MGNNMKLFKVVGFKFLEFTPYTVNDFNVVIDEPKWDKSVAEVEDKIGVTKEKNPEINGAIQISLKDDLVTVYKDSLVAMGVTWQLPHTFATTTYNKKTDLKGVRKEETRREKIQEVVDGIKKIMTDTKEIDHLVNEVNNRIKREVDGRNEAMKAQLFELLANGIQGFEGGSSWLAEQDERYAVCQTKEKELQTQIAALKAERLAIETEMREIEYAVIRKDALIGESLPKIESELERQIVTECAHHIAPGSAKARVGTKFPFR